MHKSIASFMILILVLFVGEQMAQEKQYRFRNIGVKDGLSHFAVVDIFQDRDGYIWVSTRYGINRYDGYHFKKDFDEPDDEKPLKNNVARTFYQDKDDFIWFAVIGTGVCKYDPYKNESKLYVHDPNDSSSLSDNYSNFVYLDKDNTLWVGTSSGLNRFVPESDSFVQFRHDPSDASSLCSDMLNCLLRDSREFLWVGTEEGLSCINTASGRVEHYFHIPDDPKSLIDNSISSLLEDRGGNIWIGTDKGLCRFEPGTGEFNTFDSPPSMPQPLKSGWIRSIFQMMSGEIWISVNGQGLFRYIPETGQFYRVTNNNSTHSKGDLAYVNKIYQDSAGGIWIGTQHDGIYYNNSSMANFHHYLPSPYGPGIAYQNQIYSLFETRQKEMWFGTWDEGVIRYNRKDNRYSRYRHDPKKPGSLSGDRRPMVFEDSYGTLWVGTALKGLNRFDKEKGSFDHFIHNPDVPGSISHPRIFSFMEDTARQLWVGTGDGLSKYNRSSGTFNNYVIMEKNEINAIAICDTPYGIVVASPSKLLLFDPGSGVYKPFDDLLKLPTFSFITGVYFDIKSHNLWFCTLGKGLYRMDMKNNTIRRYLEKDGLPSNMTFGVLPDKKGNLWVSNARGLSCFDPEKEIFKNYTREDGLQSDHFDWFAHYRNKVTGELFFGGDNGAISFYPDKMKINDHIPPVVLTDFKIFNRSQSVGEESLLKKVIGHSDEISLSPSQKSFTFEFAALDFAAPGKNRYQYIMEGFDRQWVTTSSARRSATYTNLDPGEYVFRVKGSNNDGKWNEEGVSFKVTIRPAFWQTWWFRLLAMVVVAAILVSVHLIRLRLMSYKIRTQAEKESIYTRYNITDREKDIIELILQGKSNKEIEDELFISIRTVKTHTYNLYKKLGVKNRLDLVTFIQQKVR